MEFDFGEAGLHDQEGRTVTAYFDQFTLVCSYVPNSGVVGLDRLDYRVKQWDKDVQRFLSEDLTKVGKPVVWCGDLNVAHQEIDIYSTKGKERAAGFTKEERESFGGFLAAGFVDTYRHFHPDTTKFSYWNLRSGARAKNQGWRLDYFVASKSILNCPSVKMVDSRIHNEIDGSDHCPISLVIEFKV